MKQIICVLVFFCSLFLGCAKKDSTSESQSQTEYTPIVVEQSDEKEQPTAMDEIQDIVIEQPLAISPDDTIADLIKAFISKVADPPPVLMDEVIMNGERGMQGHLR